MKPLAMLPVDELHLGDLKARHREQHLCLRCSHHMVCKVVAATDTTLLVTVSSCLAFELAEPRGRSGSRD